jgi:ABC-type transporter Mla maintaining outer membrane lipid asymmetry ATPase subunit MlaF
MENQTKIKVESLNLSIGNKVILNDINISIPKNKITVILGPSGAERVHS